MKMVNSPADPSTGPGRVLRIFVVENHADTSKYLRLYLEQLGHTVSEARTFHEAIDKLPGFDPDVLISDIGLPDGDGWELLRQFRPTRAVYAIAMSGFGMNADRMKSRAAGFRRHILKPFVPDELDAMLEEASREQ